jgi:ankyrin repeat protein
LEADFEGLDSKKDIPLLPDCNVTSATSKLIVQNMDPFFNTKETLSQPRLILKQMGGGFIVLPNSVFVSADTSSRKLGVVLPRVSLPDNAIRSVDSVEILFQPNPRDQRTVQAVAKITETKDSQGQTCIVIPEQFVELSPFVLKGLSAVDVLLQDVTKEDIDAAVALVNRQDSQDIFKTYGPNNDSMLMTLCCKKDDTPTIRAQVFALSARILSEKDNSLRQNLVMKNASGLSALDYTTVTNNARIAVYLAEIFYNLGQDIFCRDTSGNTILHVMARKGDSVAPTLETLLGLRFRHGNGGKVYTSNVSNGKEFLPLHIAAMSTKCPHNTIRILRNNFEQSFLARTSDGSLPLHLACQYSMDPNLLAALLYFGKASVVNERRTDGFTPLHLVAARNEARDVKLGLIPLDEVTQVRMIKLLLDHGADKNLTVEDYRPVDLIKPDRAHALQQFRLNSLARKQDRMMYAGGVSPPYMCDSPSQLSCGDRSPVMSQPSPTGPNDPFLSNGMYSDSEASPNPHQMSSWQQSPYAYHYSPSAHNGSVSSGVDNFSGASDESDEDNNSGELDAIAQVLITHPSIQAAIEAATRIN